MNAGPSLPAPAPAPPERAWARIGRKRKVLRVLAASFVVLHLLGAIHKMVPSKRLADLPRPIDLVLRHYGRSLRLAGRWNMFGSPPDHDLIFVEGRERHGGWFELANPFVRGFDLGRRIVDARLRKFHQKFSSKGQRKRWGRTYLAYLCRVGTEEHPEIHRARIVQLAPERFDDRGTSRGREKRTTTLSYRCGDPVGRRDRGRPGPGPIREGEDL